MCQSLCFLFTVSNQWFKKVVSWFTGSNQWFEISVSWFTDSNQRIEKIVSCFETVVQNLWFLIHLFESVIQNFSFLIHWFESKKLFLVSLVRIREPKRLFLDSLIRNNVLKILILGSFFVTETVKLNHLFQTNCFFANLWFEAKVDLGWSLILYWTLEVVSQSFGEIRRIQFETLSAVSENNPQIQMQVSVQLCLQRGPIVLAFSVFLYIYSGNSK